MPPPDPDERRRFFRRALSSFFEVVDDALEERGLIRRPTPSMSLPPAPYEPPKTQLRPPGALAGEAFYDTCRRGGECASACPVGAIQILESSDPRDDGTPMIVAEQGACIVCDDLSCMKACPSGALELIPKEAIAMGVAVLDESLCLRTFGDECSECVDRCPIGEKALSLDESGRLEVHAEGCVGCGVCEAACPTAPRAIQVVPE